MLFTKKWLTIITKINQVLFIIALLMVLFFYASAQADVGTFRNKPPKLRPTPSGQVTVMVIDTGVNPQNEVIAPFLRTPIDILDVDNHGHGTHVTALIVAGTGTYRNGKLQHAGPRICSNVKIIPCKFYDVSFHSKSMALERMAQCIRKAAELNVDMVNMSAGGLDYSKEEHDAMKELEKKKILVVAAAGNESSDLNILPYYPASYQLSNTIIVGSLANRLNKFSPFERSFTSNFGVPGMSWEFGEQVMSYDHNNRPVALTGTSQATALISHKILIERCNEFRRLKK
jgi:subtilisin family serine protease